MNPVRVASLSWLSREAAAAELVLRCGDQEVVAFCQPCNVEVGQAIEAPVHAFSSTALERIESSTETIRPLGGLAHWVQGQLIDKPRQIVRAKHFLIQLDDPLPGGIDESDFLQFRAGRLDVWCDVPAVTPVYLATEGTWRAHPLVHGAAYRVLKDHDAPGSRFTAGRVVTFDSAAYVRHDGLTLFRFVGSAGPSGEPQRLVWHLHDDEPDDQLLAHFSAAADAG